MTHCPTCTTPKLCNFDFDEESLSLYKELLILHRMRSSLEPDTYQMELEKVEKGYPLCVVEAVEERFVDDGLNHIKGWKR